MFTRMLHDACMYCCITNAIAVPECFAYVAKHFLMQLLHLNLGSNKLVGSLPETWSRLSNVSPLDGACVTFQATIVM